MRVEKECPRDRKIWWNPGQELYSRVVRCKSTKAFYVEHLEVHLCLTCGQIHEALFERLRKKIKGKTRRLPPGNMNPQPRRIWP